MSLGTLLFSFKGRISRKTYWLSLIAIGLVSGMMVAAMAWLVRLNLDLTFEKKVALTVIELLLFAAVLVALTAVTIKRLHDRDRSWHLLALILLLSYAVYASLKLIVIWEGKQQDYVDFWMFVFLPSAVALIQGLAPAAALLAFAGVADLYHQVQSDVWGSQAVIKLVAVLVDIFGTAVGVWYFRETGLRRGTVGPNRFGPDPIS